MKLQLNPDIAPDDRVFILQAVGSGVIIEEDAFHLLFIEED